MSGRKDPREFLETEADEADEDEEMQVQQEERAENLPDNLRRHAEDVKAHEAARADYELWSQRWSQSQKGPTLVGTASYAHTLMRVMTRRPS